MFRNYILVAWRHLVKNKGYAVINIVGLALGMAVALLIALWIADEVRYDQYYPNHARIAEVLDEQQAKGQERYTDVTIASVSAQAVRQDTDLFRRVALCSRSYEPLITGGDKTLTCSAIWAEYELPQIFGFRMRAGSAGSLRDPSTVLLSQSMAATLFGKADPMQKTIRISNRMVFRVGGVYEDQPHNTRFYGVQTLLPWTNESISFHHTNDWGNHTCLMYVELADHISAEQATARIKSYPTAHIADFLEELRVYPIDQQYLRGEFKNGVPEGGRITYVRMFAIIGLFVLLLACINFMNLSTARSEQRAKEVGIRKTIGSVRSQLVGQFLGEAVLLALASFALALFIVWLALPWFNELSAKDTFMPWGDPVLWGLGLAFTVMTGILAGSYPALYLSGFDAVKVLKGSYKAGRSVRLPRQILVVLQFSVSLSLIIGTLVVYKQIQTSKDRSIGYERSGLITVGINTSELSGHFDALRNDILKTGVAENMAESSYPTTDFGQANSPTWDGQTPEQKALFYRDVNVTREYGKTVGWTIVQGRDFSRDYPTDSTAAILNEEAVRISGFKHPIGQVVRYFDKPRTVIGVVKNMLANSPYEPMEPQIFLGDGWLGTISIRIKPGVSMHQAIEALTPVFKRHNPASPFLPYFTDLEYAKKFESESRIGQLAGIFAGLAIFISCLGLFGLASFVAEQRTKEIGLRKLLGAGVFNLWGMLLRDFVLLVLLSMVVAMPVAYWVMKDWLEIYPIHTDIPWWIFAVAGGGILLITVATVSYQTVRAAMMTPVRSLRAQ